MKKIIIVAIVFIAILFSLSMIGEHNKIEKENSFVLENKNLGESDIPFDNGI